MVACHSGFQLLLGRCAQRCLRMRHRARATVYVWHFNDAAPGTLKIQVGMTSIGIVQRVTGSVTGTAPHTIDHFCYVATTGAQSSYRVEQETHHRATIRANWGSRLCSGHTEFFNVPLGLAQATIQAAAAHLGTACV